MLQVSWVKSEIPAKQIMPLQKVKINFYLFFRYDYFIVLQDCDICQSYSKCCIFLTLFIEYRSSSVLEVQYMTVKIDELILNGVFNY